LDVGVDPIAMESIYWCVYIRGCRRMVHKAKVFISGNSQAVRLPKEYQFSDPEVQIQRIGHAVILLPPDDPWELFRDSLEQFSDDFMAEGRQQPEGPERDMNDVFD
jgi:antitoxin VapB